MARFSEEAVVAALLHQNISPEEISTHVSPNEFYDPFLKSVYQAIIDHAAKGKLLDFHSAAELFPDQRSYLGSIAKDVITANAIEHAKAIREAHTIHEFKQSWQDKIEKIKSTEDLEEARSELVQMETGRIADTGKGLRDLAVQTIERLEELDTHQYKQRIINFPLPTLQKATGGIGPGQLVVIAARPSIGKSAFAMQLAWEAANRGNTGVVFHLEMSEFDVIKRAIAYETDRPIRRQDHQIQQEFLSLIMQINGDIVSEFNAFDIRSIEAKAVSAVRNLKCEYAIVDYLQIVGGFENLATHTRIGQITRRLKLLGKRLEIPIIVLAQINREGEGMRPTLNQLKDSGSIEQDADLILLLHGDRNEEGPDRVTEICVAKNRNGRTGWVTESAPVTYCGPTFRFVEVGQNG